MKTRRFLFGTMLCTMLAFLSASCDKNENTKEPEVKVDKTELQAEITKAEGLLAAAVTGTNPGQYPQAAYDEFKGAIDAAKSVNTSESVSQDDVDNAVDTLIDAEKAFAKAVVPEPDINTKPLEYAINTAETLVEEAVVGPAPGQFPQAAVDALKAAIDDAKAVLNKAGVTQDELDAAEEALNAAVDTFKASDSGDAALALYLPFNGNSTDLSARKHEVELRPSEGTSDQNFPVLTTDRHGEADKAYAFNGGMMNIPFDVEFTSNTLSIMYWQYQDVLSATDMAPVSMQWWDCWLTKVLAKDGINTPAAQIGSPVESGFELELGKWYHVAVTRSETEVAIYVNGELLNTAEASGQLNVAGISQPLRIGAMSENGGYFLPFIGKLDEVRLYSRALSADEIAGIYESEK